MRLLEPVLEMSSDPHCWKWAFSRQKCMWIKHLLFFFALLLRWVLLHCTLLWKTKNQKLGGEKKKNFQVLIAMNFGPWKFHIRVRSSWLLPYAHCFGLYSYAHCSTPTVWSRLCPCESAAAAVERSESEWFSILRKLGKCETSTFAKDPFR